MNHNDHIPILHQSSARPALQVSSLSAGAQMFVLGLRQWTRAAQQKQCVYRLLHAPFAALDCGQAVVHLDELMCVLAMASFRSVNVYCPHGKLLSDDERQLVDVMRSLQKGDDDQAYTLLSELIHGPMNRSFRRAASDFVGVLREANLSFSAAPHLELVKS